MQINVVWEILVPENRGNCTVSISNGQQTEESFKILQPNLLQRFFLKRENISSL